MASELERLVDRIYESVAHPERWAAVARGLVRCAEAISCSIQIRSLQQTRVIGAFGYKALDSAVYEKHFAHRDVRAKALMRLPANETHAMHHYLSQRRFTASDYYNDYFRHVTDGFWSSAWWTPVSTVSRSNRSVMAFGVHRPQTSDPDDPALEKLFRAVTPHLRQAARLLVDFEDLNLRLDMARGGLDGICHPVMLLDRTGRVADMNRAAQDFLRARVVIRVEADGSLGTRNRKMASALKMAIGDRTRDRRHAGGLSDLRMQDESSGEMFALSFLPLMGRDGVRRPGALLTIRMTGEAGRDARLQAIALRFHLTPAEQRLVRALADGHTLESAADSFEIRRSTAATQLRSIFAKTGTHRQAELVRMVLAAPE
jgi:DNA-binding CsgD family transcriptional regulator